MTTPKIPGQRGLPLKQGTGGLDDTIKELEGLITTKASVPQKKTSAAGIPVLDDIIDTDSVDYMEDMEMLLAEENRQEPAPEEEHISPEQLEHIIDNVEAKLASELDALVTILKDTVKDSIMTEIKSQFETGLHKSKTEKPDGESSS